MASPWPGRGSGAGACPSSSTRGRGGHLQHTPRSGDGSEATISFVQRGYTRCVCGVGVGGRTLSRGKLVWSGGVEVSFGMAVWRYGGTSLTHSPCRRTPFARAALGFTTRGLTQYILLKLPLLRCPASCAPLRSRFAFLAILMMDGSRAISLSPEKRPPRISSGYFHTEMFLAKAAEIRDVHNGLRAWRMARN